VFISYRRQDTAFPAGWLYEQLVNHFGEPHVFKDVDSIQPGEDFVNAITTAVRSCHTLLVLIGPQWVSILDKHGARRLDQPNDSVRLEIESGFAQGLQIIPVLVLDAVMPTEEELPPSITALARRHAIEITSTHFQADLARLIRSVERGRQERESDTRHDAELPVHHPAPAQPNAPLLADRYSVGETLGHGGMSEVHRGLDTRLGRDVAVKVLRADLARDPQFQMRFRREAQNAAALNHPAIVAVYDTGEVPSDFGPLPYIVMEYVDGHTLREIVTTTGPMSRQKVIDVMADVCAALDFSHLHGIIHRDVKPANIMINRAGAVKVMDFGIAHALGDGQNLTHTAAVIGTAQYLSPEQARGEAVDARSDVYAVGCVLFELLTGEPPFTGDSPVAVVYQHVREAPRSPSELNRAISPALDAVVLKALAKNPANRYQSAAEMRSDLVRVRSGQAPMAPAVLREDERTAMLTPGPPSRPDVGIRYAPPTGFPVNNQPRRGTGTKIVAGALALVLLGLIGFVGYQLLTRPSAFDGQGSEQIAVPAVIGATETDARSQIRNAGLTIGQVQQTSSAVDQIGKVISTDPAPDVLVDPDTAVDLSVGSGPAQVPVPRLIGLSVADATGALADVGLALGAQTPVEGEPGQVGKVIGCDPVPGTLVASGSRVGLRIGKARTAGPGPDPVDPVPVVTVPAVAGQAADDAQRTLEAAGFRVERNTVEAGGDAGSVVGTDPPAGAKAKKGSTVTLNLSSGDSGRPVPNVVGLSATAATDILAAAGFRNVSTQSISDSDPGNDGKVLGQEPPAGSQADTNVAVTLTVGQLVLEGG